MPKKPLPYVLAVLVIISAFFSWQAVNSAIVVEGASNFLVPILWFSVLAIILSLMFSLVGERLIIIITIITSLVLSFIFVHDYRHLIAFAIAIGFLLASRELVKADIDLSIEISLGKSLNRGMFSVVFAFAFMVTSQFFFTAITLDTNKLIPKLQANNTSTVVISFVLSKISPGFKAVESKELSVDEFLSELFSLIIKKETEAARDKLGINTEDLSERSGLSEDQVRKLEGFVGGVVKEPVQNITEEIKRTAVAGWKKELSKLAGFTVEGDENISEILVAIINARVNKFADPSLENSKNAELLPAVLSLILFLTIIPLGGLLSKIWIYTSWFLFWILKRSGIVKIRSKTSKIEVLQR